MSDPFFERRLAVLVRDALDAETGPHPIWAESPAFTRVNAPARRRPALGGLRLLAVAALLVVGAAAAVGAYLARPPVVPEVPVENGWLAYVGSGSLEVTREGTAPRRVADANVGQFACPHFLPDGTLTYSLAVTQGAQVDRKLVLVRLGEDGTPQEPMRALPLPAGMASWCGEWSPDGSRLAYAQGQDGPEDLAIMSLDGAENVVMPKGAFDYGEIEWSPDGSALAAVANTGPTGHTSQLWIIELGTGAARVAFAAADGDLVETVAWSPDGTRIALGGTSAHVTVGANGDVWSADTGHFVKLIALDGSADGVVSIDELPAPQPDPFAEAWTLFSGPAWSPDSTSLAWIRAGRLTVLESDDPDPISHALELDRAAWAAQLIGWSPDGRSLLTTVYDTPYRERFVQSSLVAIAADQSSSPITVIPWSLGWKNEADWQSLDGTTPADLSAVPTFVMPEAPRGPVASSTPTAPPVKVIEN